MLVTATGCQRPRAPGQPPMPHPLATISSHGLGHLAQSAPVLNALRRVLPGLRLTVASMLSAERLRARIDGEFDIEARALDVGFEMHDAFRVARSASAGAYRAFHANWEQRLAETRAWLVREQPDLVLANVAYLPLAGSRTPGHPRLRHEFAELGRPGRRCLRRRHLDAVHSRADPGCLPQRHSLHQTHPRHGHARSAQRPLGRPGRKAGHAPTR